MIRLFTPWMSTRIPKSDAVKFASRPRDASAGPVPHVKANAFARTRTRVRVKPSDRLLTEITSLWKAVMKTVRSRSPQLASPAPAPAAPMQGAPP